MNTERKREKEEKRELQQNVVQIAGYKFKGLQKTFVTNYIYTSQTSFRLFSITTSHK
jgi:hypothetical protein